jgi:hypothetical protein
MSNQRPVVDKKDQTKGIIAAVLIIAAIIIYLKFAFYLMADPPPKDYPVVTELNLPEELQLEKLVIEGGSSGGGSGTPSDDKVTPKPEEQTEKIITKEEAKSSVDTGESNKTNATESKNEATTTVKSKNPFGSGGDGDLDGVGSGDVFGIDNGDERGKGDFSGNGNRNGIGNGNGKAREKRKIENGPDEFNSDKDGIVYLQVTINAEGDVIKVINLNSETTITDQRVINQVVSNVKSKVKYNKMPGTTPQTQTLKVKVSRI